MRFKLSVATSQFRLLPIALCVSSLILASCGGNSGDSTSSTQGDLLPVDGGSAVSADEVDTAVLLRKAATGVSSHLGKNITSMQRLGGNSSSLGVLLNTASLSSTEEEADFESDEDVMTSDEVLDTPVEEGISGFFDALLGLDEEMATVTRTGNLITIDPNESAFCGGELLADDATADETADCQSIVSHILVELDALTEDSGLITVNFAQQELLLVGYSPAAVNYEIKLAGLESLLTQGELLDGESGGTVPSMQGAVRLTATMSDDTAGAESGTMSISVTEALSIVDNAGSQLSLQPSTLLSISTDAATNSGSLEFNVGALSASMTSDNGMGGVTTTALAFSGLTARMDVSNNGDSLVVSQLGMGNGPLTLTTDSVEQMRLMLETFGFTVDGENDVITLDDDLDFELSLGQVNSLAAQAISGTTFATQGSGVSQVSQGGPLVVSITGDNDGTAVSDSISIGAGSCFASDDDSDSILPFTLVECEL